MEAYSRGENTFAGWCKRDVILQELSCIEEMIEGLELEMQKIAAHEIDQAKVRQEYEQLLQWFERGEDRSVEEMPYTMKRNLLRIIALRAYVFKTDKRHEDIQYDIKGNRI